MRNANISINLAIMYAARPIRNTSGNSIITITNHLELYTKRFQFIMANVIQNLFLVIKSYNKKSLKINSVLFFINENVISVHLMNENPSYLHNLAHFQTKL